MLCYAAIICTPRYDCINVDIFDVDAIFSVRSEPEVCDMS